MNFNKDNEQKLVNNRHKENTQATNCDRFYMEELWLRLRLRRDGDLSLDSLDSLNSPVSRWSH